MNISARAQYACLAVMDMAERYHDPGPVKLADIADRQAIPQRFLVQIMIQMKNSGIVITNRGSAGGYRLAKGPETITIADVLGVLDRLEKPMKSDLGESPFQRALNDLWRLMAKHRNEYLAKMTIADLLPKDEAPDYTI